MTEQRIEVTAEDGLEEREQTLLRRVLGTLTGLVAVCAVAEMVGWAVTGHDWLLPLGLSTCALLVPFGFGLFLNHRHRPELATSVVGVGLLAVAAVYVGTVSQLFLLTLFVVPVTVLLALPYVPLRYVWLVIALAWALEVSVALVPWLDPNPLPASTSLIVAQLGTVAVGAITLLLVGVAGSLRRRQHVSDVEYANQELVRINEELEAFIYTMSHDLRSPLHAIQGFASALEEDYGDALDATGRDYVDRVQKNVRRAELTIDDLLELARVRRATLDVTEVNVSELCQAIAEDLMVAEPHRHVDTKIDPDIKAWGDRDLLMSLFANLLFNAWKFTSREAHPVIQVWADVRSGGQYIVVKDNGVGFPQKHAHRLFEPFERLHAAKDFAGTGIGLASVRRIARRHGGDVEAEGAVDRGAQFRLWLPATKPARESTARGIPIRKQR